MTVDGKLCNGSPVNIACHQSPSLHQILGKLKELLLGILPEKKNVSDYIVDIDSRSLGRKRLHVNASAIPVPREGWQLFLLVISLMEDGKK